MPSSLPPVWKQWTIGLKRTVRKQQSRNKKAANLKSNFNAPFLIAKRYFVANPEKRRLIFNLGFIKILSGISMLAVCLGTAALVTVLSVFNGMEGLTKQLFRQHNAELKAEPVKGKAFELTEELRNDIERTPFVAAVTEVIEDNALLRYKESQMVVKLKGVSDNFQQQYKDLESALIVGDLALEKDSTPYALLGIGVYDQMNIRVNDNTHALQFWYPKKGKQVLNPAKAFNRRSILPGGGLSIEQQFDANYVLVSLDFMRSLVGYDKERSYLEIKVTDPKKIPELQASLQELLGEELEVKNAEQQQASILRAVKIEKLFVGIALVFLVGLASFNIFASLVILALEKRRDIAIFKSMGATPAFIRNIFLYEGLLIGGMGTAVGLIIGGVLCYLQEAYGLIGMGVETAIINAYPIELRMGDFVFSGLAIFGITLLSSWIPARNAAKTEIEGYV